MNYKLLTQFSQNNLYVFSQLEELAIGMVIPAPELPKELSIGTVISLSNSIVTFDFKCTELDEREELNAHTFKLISITKHLSPEVDAKVVMLMQQSPHAKQGDTGIVKSIGFNGHTIALDNGREIYTGFKPVFMVISPPSVITHVFMKPKPGCKGTSIFDRYATYGEIVKQTHIALKAIHSPSIDCNALGGAEYYRTDDELDLQKSCESGTFVAIPRKGNCEGQRLELLFFPSDAKNHYVEIFSAKYFCSQDDIWMIARRLNEAIERGYW